MTNEEFQKLIIEKFNSLEEFQKLALEKFDSLEQKITDIKKGQTELKRQVGATYEQVAGLLEYRSEMKETQKSIKEILADHEIDIRTLKRKPV